MDHGQGPPVPGAGAVDLDALRRGGELPPLTGEPIAFYANDVQPSVETEGNVTLMFRWLGPDGASQPVHVSIPAGLLLTLTMLAPQVVEQAAIRYQKQADGMRQFLQGAQETVADVQQTRRTGGGPHDLTQRRGQ